MSLPTKPGYYYWRQPGTICPFGQPESRIVWFHPDEPATHVATGEWGPRIPEPEQLQAMWELADAVADAGEAEGGHVQDVVVPELIEVLPAPRLAATYLDALVEKVRKA